MDTQASGSQAGFYYQNLIASLEALNLLFDDDTLSVIVEKEDAPHIDDVTVLRNDKAIFYQAKFENSDTPSNLTNSDLFGSGDDKKSLWRKLAIGWQECRKKDRKIEVTLITNKPLSNNRSNIRGVTLASPRELQDGLLLPCREAVESGKSFSPPDKWRDDWDNIREFSGLGDQFEEFVSCLRLKASSDSKQELLRRITNQLQLAVGDFHEAEQLQSFLISSIVKWASCPDERDRIIDRNKLEKELRLSERRKLRHRHELSLPNDYTPFGDLVDTIWKRISSLKRGYVFVRGVPGSGKTVAITALLERHPEIHLRYYAYDPNESVDRSERVRKKDFYHDLLVQFSDRFRGKYQGILYPHVDRWEDNRKNFWNELNRFIQESKTSFIVVVDGLDHAVRCRSEEAATFLDSLPKPEDLSEGLVFVLAGQPGWQGYPEWLEDDTRVNIIDVPRMTKDETAEYLRTRNEWSSDEYTLDAVSQMISNHTEGNPLSIRITVRAIHGLSTVDEIRKAYQKGKLPGKDPHIYYEDIWTDISNLKYFNDCPAHLQRAQAIFSVARSPISEDILSDVFEVLDRYEAKQILVRLKPLLSKEPDGYTISDNDFRVFIETKTDLNDKKDAHRRLASYYMDNQYSDASHRYLALHLEQAEMAKELWQLVTRERVEQKIRIGRSDEEIRQELNRAWRTALIKRNVEEIYRIGFLLMEQYNRIEIIKIREMDLPYTEVTDSEWILALLSQIPPHPDAPISESIQQRGQVLDAVDELLDKGFDKECSSLWNRWAIPPLQVFEGMRGTNNRMLFRVYEEYFDTWFSIQLYRDPDAAVRELENLLSMSEEWMAKSDEDFSPLLRTICINFIYRTAQRLQADDFMDIASHALDNQWPISWNSLLYGIERMYAAGAVNQAKALWEYLKGSAQGESATQMAYLGVRLALLNEEDELVGKMRIPSPEKFIRESRLGSQNYAPILESELFAWAFVKGYFDFIRPFYSFCPDLSQLKQSEINEHGNEIRTVVATAVLSARLHRNPRLVAVRDLAMLLEMLFKPTNRYRYHWVRTRIALAEYLLPTIDRFAPSLSPVVTSWLLKEFPSPNQNELSDPILLLMADWLWQHNEQGRAQSILNDLCLQLGHQMPSDRADRLAEVSKYAKEFGFKEWSMQLTTEARIAALGPRNKDDYQLNSWIDFSIPFIQQRHPESLRYARRFAYYATLLTDETGGPGTMWAALKSLIPEIFLINPEIGERLLIETAEDFKGVAVDSALLLDISRILIENGNLKREDIWALAALIRIGGLTNHDYGWPEGLSALLVELKRVAGESDLASLVDHLDSCFEDVRPDKEKDEDKGRRIERQDLPRFSTKDIEDFFTKAGKWELLSEHRSGEQENVFNSAIRINPNQAKDLYIEAVLRVMAERVDGFSDEYSIKGMLHQLSRLVNQTLDGKTKLAILKMMDEHMQALLTFSINNELLNLDPEGNLDSEGELLTAAIDLVIHMLGSRYTRTILEAGRALSLLANVNADKVVERLVHFMGNRDMFFDRWILLVLLGLSYGHPSAITPYVSQITPIIDEAKDLVLEYIIDQIMERCGEAQHRIIVERNTKSGNVITLPPKSKIAYVEEQTVDSGFSSTVNNQIESRARALADASDLQREYVETRIYQEAEHCSIEPEYHLSGTEKMHLPPTNIAFASGRVAKKLLMEGKADIEKRRAMVQSLREVDSILLTSIPESFPECVNRLTNDGDDEEWINGSGISMYYPFQDNTWRVIGCYYEQATGRRYECLTCISCLVSQEIIEHVRENSAEKKLLHYRGTWGLTLDAMHEEWWEMSSSEIADLLPITIPSGGLIAIPQAMLRVIPSNALIELGIRPDPRSPHTWFQNSNQAIKLRCWDNGDTLDKFSITDEDAWRSWGHLWLIHTDTLKQILNQREKLTFIQVFNVERTTRKYPRERFDGKVNAFWNLRVTETSK